MKKRLAGNGGPGMMPTEMLTGDREEIQSRDAENCTEIVADRAINKLTQRWQRYMRAGCGKDGSDMLKASGND